MPLPFVAAIGGFAEYLSTHLTSLPPLARFAIALATVFLIPPLSRRLKLPSVVGLLLAGVVLGPHVLDVFGNERPIADFMADLGKLLLMFYAGLEVDLALFRQSQRKVVMFGLATTTIPLILGAVVGWWFGYRIIPAVVLGSLLAPHTLLGRPILAELGAGRLEPVVVTVGATVLSDMLSLVVFAVCVSTYEQGFAWSVLMVQLVEIVGFVLLVVFGIGRVATYTLKKVEDHEDAFFVLLFGVMALAGVLAAVVQLPDIVGAFLAGLALNEAAQNRPAEEKLGFLANALFIPLFFVVTGFLIDPGVLVQSLFENFWLASSILLAVVVGKGLAAESTGRAFKYPPAARLTVWSLTLPHVAATLAATLVGFNTFDPHGRRLIDERILNSVFMLMLITSILGPILTQRYGPMMADAYRRRDDRDAHAA